jgi:iron complex outermembrane receptor protein
MYNHTSGFSIGPNVEWAPESFYVDSANTTKTVPYALLGVRAVYDDGKRFSAYIDGRNLTDERYFASASAVRTYTEAFDPGNGIFPTRVFEPGEGRGVYGGIKYRW